VINIFDFLSKSYPRRRKPCLETLRWRLQWRISNVTVSPGLVRQHILW